MKKTVWTALLAFTLLAGLLVTGVSAAGLLTGGALVLAEETGMIKGAIAGETVRFSATDFKQAMGIRRFESITVTSLPDAEAGTLYFGKEGVTAPVTLPRESLSSLTFVPKDKKVTEATFTFTCEGYAGGAEIRCDIRFAEKLNRAPTVSDVAASRRVSTFRTLSAEGTLCATDPEGDALEFIVVEYPKNGSLVMLDRAVGDFRYTPTGSYTGRNSFTFVVRDLYGNYSAPAEVEVTVEKTESALVYRDLVGTAACLPAIALAEENIMLGTLVGDGMYFSPEETITRGDFLVMAMKASGISPRTGLAHTVFDDDAAIPDGIRPYAATAQEAGYILGRLGEEGLLFASSEEITRGEAAVVLARILEIKLPASVPLYPDSGELPSSVREATLALSAAGIYPRTEEGMLAATEPLDRAAAAEMLYAAMLHRK